MFGCEICSLSHQAFYWQNWFIIFGYVILLILASLWHLKVDHSKVDQGHDGFNIDLHRICSSQTFISAPARLRSPWHHCFLLHSFAQGWRIQRGKAGPLESDRHTILECVCAYDQQTCSPAQLLASCHVNLVSKHACQCWHTLRFSTGSSHLAFNWLVRMNSSHLFLFYLPLCC